MKTGRLGKLVAIATIATSLGIGTIAQTAEAGRLISSGTIGYVGLPTGKCKYHNAWNRLDVTVAPPAIYAPNVTAGSWNDAAWARYQVLVVDRYGRTVRTSNYSSWVATYDSQAGYFSGAPLTFTNIPEFSTVRIGVEWVGPNYSSASIYQLDKYELITGGIGPFGGLNSCSKWTWTP